MQNNNNNINNNGNIIEIIIKVVKEAVFHRAYQKSALWTCVTKALYPTTSLWRLIFLHCFMS